MLTKRQLYKGIEMFGFKKKAEAPKTEEPEIEVAHDGEFYREELRMTQPYARDFEELAKSGLVVVNCQYSNMHKRWRILFIKRKAFMSE